MTLPPIIVTAHVVSEDLEFFNALRRRHFPAERNFLDAHITMFHHLPGRYLEEIKDIATDVLSQSQPFVAEVAGVRHLGSGVAFQIASGILTELRAALKNKLGAWPGPQDQQKFQPHITIQNKVARSKADKLFFELRESYQPRSILITGIDLWSYLNGPWRHEAFIASAIANRPDFQIADTV
ncbi:2'-5' RNA ligase family protein [Oryzifoliimicrobium ureilyticus]|uniref:2'-5' RNA ligase family protein n=1 Tax=Oryzifoliimicrobium ureilyticus TaxID=3113724 RepID=UPI003075F805